MPKHIFVVSATVADPDKRQAFDDWYRREHLPQAMAAFGAERAWRCWSVADPSKHHASYVFADRDALDRGVGSAQMKTLVADFDRDWPGVTRSREILVLAEEAAGAKV